MKNIIFLSDFFIDDFIGGAEASDEALIESLHDASVVVKKVHCRNFENLHPKEDNFYIVSNFATLDQKWIDFLTKKCSYVIYEHDYKFLSQRDPAKYENNTPRDCDVVNLDFYMSAMCVFLQTMKHAEIYLSTTKLKNYEIIGGSLWTKSNLEILQKYANKEKIDKYAIVGYVAYNKGRQQAVEYCIDKKLDYEIVQSNRSFESFIEDLSKYKKLVFMPKCYESCSRITLEARMLNMGVVLNNNVPVKYEEYFNKTKGLELIEMMKNIPKIIAERIIFYSKE